MVIGKYRKEHPNVCVVEGGGWAEGQSESQKFQSLFVARMMGDLGYAVVSVGPSDLLYGVQTLQETAKKAGLTLISSNILKKSTGKLLFQPSVVREYQGVRVGFLGCVANSANLATVNPEADDFAVADPESTLRALVPQVRKKADVIVVFDHRGSRASQQLADEVKGIDVIVTGGEAMVNSKPVEVGNEDIGHTLVCAAGDRGKWIGALSLIVSDKGKVLRWTHEMHGLDSNVPEDSTMRVKVDAFKEQLREVKKREVVEEVVGQQTSQGPHEKFLGASTCKRCHEAAFAAWDGSAHAHSLGSLEGKSMENSSECLTCHVTGHSDPTGFAFNKVDLGNVSCEQCHGQGTTHGDAGFIAHPTPESCMVCHDKKNSPKFDYAKYWKEIAH